MKVRDEELFALAEDELVTSRANEIRADAETSPELAERIEESEALLSMLAEPDPELADVDLVAGIRTRLDAPPPKKNHRWWWAGAVAAAAAMAFVPLAREQIDDGEFTAKRAISKDADRWAGVKAYVVEASGTTRPLGTALTSEDSVVFTYSNLGAAPYDYLMIYGVDVENDVHWYYPAYTDANTDPAAVRILPGTGDAPLPDRVAHDLPSGRYVLHAVFMRDRRTVKAVERAVGEIESAKDVHVQRIEVVVP